MKKREIGWWERERLNVFKGGLVGGVMCWVHCSADIKKERKKGGKKKNLNAVRLFILTSKKERVFQIEHWRNCTWAH